MTQFSRRSFIALAATSTAALMSGSGMAFAENAAKRAKIDSMADASLAKLLASNSTAKALADKAVTILTFPRITEAGIVGIGAKRGAGVLRQNGKSIGYYRTTSASFGAGLGFETHGYVLMFMTHEIAQKFADHKNNFDLGAQGELTIFRAGGGGDIDTENLKSSIVGFMFDEKGAIMDLTFEGTEIHHLKI